MQPSTIKLFLVTGNPEGLRTAELSNWSGKAFAGPRSELNGLLAREEIASPGVYILAGHEEDNEQPAVYVGEAEKVTSRLKQHTDNDFWQHAIVFISKDENLTKSHIRFLEGELIRIARNAGRSILKNSQSSGAKLPESDRADMEGFLEKILQLLPVLGVTAFKPSASCPKRPDTSNDLFCKVKSKGLKARGRRTEAGFIVYKDSQAVLKHRPSGVNAKKKRDKLLQNAILVEHGDHLLFSQDYEFSSPSAAVSIILGGQSNGLVCWRDAKGMQLKDIESSAVAPEQ